MPNANEHQGRIAVVTGGNGGAIAKRLISEGAIVHILDVKAGESSARFHTLDIGDEASVNRVFAAIGAEHGVIDYLICCAGIYRPQPFLELSLDAWRRTLDVNLTGMFLSCRAALKFMMPRRFGRIVLFSSMAARTGGKNVAHYAASKGGVLGLTRALAVEAATDNIRVNAISPVITNTPMPPITAPPRPLSTR